MQGRFITRQAIAIKPFNRLATVLLVVGLAGCAGTMQDVNNAMKTMNQTLSGATTVAIGKLGDGTGYQPPLTAPMPKDACHQQAFVYGFKDTYLQNWQTFVDMKVTTYQNLSRGKGGDSTAKKNLALYKSRQIGMAGYVGHSSDYPPNYGGNQCPYQSYILGQQAGLDAYTRDMKTLSAQELPTQKAL